MVLPWQPRIVAKNIFPPTWHFKAWDMSKSQIYYENLLIKTGSMKIKYNTKKEIKPIFLTIQQPKYSALFIPRMAWRTKFLPKIIV
jgi:hypothetical protein